MLNTLLLEWKIRWFAFYWSAAHRHISYAHFVRVYSSYRFALSQLYDRAIAFRVDCSHYFAARANCKQVSRSRKVTSRPRLHLCMCVLLHSVAGQVTTHLHAFSPQTLRRWLERRASSLKRGGAKIRQRGIQRQHCSSTLVLLGPSISPEPYAEQDVLSWLCVFYFHMNDVDKRLVVFSTSSS